jgi:hypothetical protein
MSYRLSEEIGLRSSLDTTTGVLSIVIPFTTPELTRVALRHAGVCTDLDVHVSLVEVQVVPFPCPLDQPPVNTEFSEHRLQGLLKESGLPGQTAVLHSRNWLEGFGRVVGPGSLVVLAARKHWWGKTREEKLARTLSKAGHHVMLLRAT